MKALFFGLLVTVLAIWLPLSGARSETGDDFDAAVEAWLDDDDASALPIMARLARSGDERAMLFLGQFVQRTGRFSKFLSGLGFKERKTLLMAPGGLSGISWLHKVAKNKELAKALIVAPDMAEKVQNIETLLKHDETGPAIRLIATSLSGNYHNSIFVTPTKYPFPREGRALLWLWAASRDDDPASDDIKALKSKLTEEAQKALDEGSFQGFLLIALMGISHDNDAVRFLSQSVWLGWVTAFNRFEKSVNQPEKVVTKLKDLVWRETYRFISTADETRNLFNVCKKLCPSDVENCSMNLYAAIGGYFTLMQIQPPLERLIPTSDFFRSKRYEAELFRNTNDWEMDQIRQKVGEKGTCVMRLHADYN